MYTKETEFKIDSLTKEMDKAKLSIETIANAEFKHGVQVACEEIRCAIAQYALDNKLKLGDVQPYVEITETILKELEER